MGILVSPERTPSNHSMPPGSPQFGHGSEDNERSYSDERSDEALPRLSQLRSIHRSRWSLISPSFLYAIFFCLTNYLGRQAFASFLFALAVGALISSSREYARNPVNLVPTTRLKPPVSPKQAHGGPLQQRSSFRLLCGVWLGCAAQLVYSRTVTPVQAPRKLRDH